MVELCELLTDAELRTTMHAASVQLPGGWLTLDELAPRFNLAGDGRLVCSLYLVSPDTGDTQRTLDDLLAMLNQCIELGVRPDGPVTATRVVFEANPTPQPALRVPIHL